MSGRAVGGMCVVSPKVCVRARVVGMWLTREASRRLWRATPRYSFCACGHTKIIIGHIGIHREAFMLSRRGRQALTLTLVDLDAIFPVGSSSTKPRQVIPQRSYARLARNRRLQKLRRFQRFELTLDERVTGILGLLVWLGMLVVLLRI